MTLALTGDEVAAKLEQRLQGAVVESSGSSLLVKTESLFDLLSFLKIASGLDLDYLTSVTAADYGDYFELVYHLSSIEHNHSLVVKARCHDRENPTVPSVVGLWRGADLQEREICDLMGINFEGHPNLKHIVLWEGFQGHPLRKDYS